MQRILTMSAASAMMGGLASIGAMPAETPRKQRPAASKPPPVDPANETRQQRRARERRVAKDKLIAEKAAARRKGGYRTGGGF